MKVLLNSDVTYSQRLLANLPQQLVALADACKERTFEITLPLTTVLEFERQQLAIAAQTRAALGAAAANLDSYGIQHDAINLDQLIKTRSLSDLFAKTGVKVEIVSPTIDDFNDAHRRASLHLSPQVPNDKGEDEMRDLVIWAISIRVATEQGGALLVSRDKIHVGDLGRNEAQVAGLAVMPSVDDALRFLKIETPDAKLFIEMLTPVWKDLPGHGLPVSEVVSVSDVRNARFVQGASGQTFALATVHVGLEGGGEKATVIQLKKQADGSTTVHVFDVDVAQEVTIQQVEAAPTDPAYEERLARLRKVLGG